MEVEQSVPFCDVLRCDFFDSTVGQENRANRDGLDKAALADRFSQLAKLHRVEMLARLVGVRDNKVEGDALLHGRAPW
nr:hypothetical protein [Mesorhizobium sp.]